MPTRDDCRKDSDALARLDPLLTSVGTFTRSCGWPSLSVPVEGCGRYPHPFVEEES